MSKVLWWRRLAVSKEARFKLETTIIKITEMKTRLEK